MALPEQIRRQLEQVEEITKTAYPAASETSSTETAPTSEGTQTPPVEATQVQPVTQAQNAGQSVSNVIPIESAPAPSDNWELKYRTLQGKYDAEIPRMQQQLRELAAQNVSYQQLLSNLNSSNQQAPVQGTQPVQKLTTDKDVTDYGADTIDLIRRVTREELSPIIARLEGQLSHFGSQMTNQVQQVQSRQILTAEQTFFMQLGQAVPDWRTVNADPRFRAWLAEVDNLTGITRQTYLDDARQNLDVNRVANIFSKWRSEAGSAPASQPAPKVNPASELERQIAPGKSRTDGAPPTNPNANKRTWTRDEISKYYDEVRRGVYNTRKQERDQIERDIFEAQRDGRIVAK